MANSHGAVILLTRDAVASPWVLKEATILAWRLSIDTNFRLFTVRFPDVTDEMLAAAKFGPLMLGQIQRIAAVEPDDIAADVRAALRQPAPSRTPFDDLVRNLAILFRKMDEGKLEQVAETMNIERPAWRPERDLRSQYAEVIARRIVCEDLGGYEGLEVLINDLISTEDSDAVEKILWIVAPYWVPIEVAGRLAALGSTQPRRAAAMNGRDVLQFTAPMYVRRAHPLSRLHQTVPLPGDAPGDLKEYIVDEICKWYRARRLKSGDNRAILAEIKAPESGPPGGIPRTRHRRVPGRARRMPQARGGCGIRGLRGYRPEHALEARARSRPRRGGDGGRVKRSLISMGDALLAIGQLGPRDAAARNAILEMLGLVGSPDVPVPRALGPWQPSSSETVAIAQRRPRCGARPWRSARNAGSPTGSLSHRR